MLAKSVRHSILVECHGRRRRMSHVSYEMDRKGDCWLDVKHMSSGEVVKTVKTQAYKADKVCAGMLINMSEEYFVDYRYEFPRKGEKDRDGKVAE
jgi:hypothetical protein